LGLLTILSGEAATNWLSNKTANFQRSFPMVSFPIMIGSFEVVSSSGISIAGGTSTVKSSNISCPEY